MGSRYNCRLHILEILEVNKMNPNRWILKEERYFVLQQYTNYENIEAKVNILNDERNIELSTSLDNIVEDTALRNSINWFQPKIRPKLG